MKYIIGTSYVPNTYFSGRGGSYILALDCGHFEVMKASVYRKKATGKVHCRACENGREVV